MVQLHIKKGDESAFLYQISVATSLSELVPKVATLYNDRRRLERLISGSKCEILLTLLNYSNSRSFKVWA